MLAWDIASLSRWLVVDGVGSVRRAALCCDAEFLLVVVRGFLATAREREDSEELGEEEVFVVGGSEKDVVLDGLLERSRTG